MRLTLRTLLAYLDDVLDSSDKEELSKKIQSSEFAEDLVHRTRDTMRRLRLSAPQLIGTGMGLDPNSVAEYLDNVMPPDAVGDFERICLESDVHLAEAAACHHVLTMVLGQPAEVDPIARQRMYTLPSEVTEQKKLRIEPAHVPMQPAVASAVVAPQPAHTADALPTQHKVEIPEYLRAGSWSQSGRAAAVLAALVLLGAAILFASGLRGWFGKKTPSMVALTADSAQPAEGLATNDSVLSEPSAPGAMPPAATEDFHARTTTTMPLAGPPQPVTPGITTPATTSPVASSPSQIDPYAVTGTPTVSGAETPAAPPTQPALVPTTDPAMLPANTAAIPPAAGPVLPPSNTAAASPAGESVPTNDTSVQEGAPATSSSAASSAGDVSLPLAAAAANTPVPPAALPSAEAATNTVPPQAPDNAPPAEAVADAGASLAAAARDAGAAGSPLDLPPAMDADGKIDGKPPVPAGPPELGTYLGGKTVLLRQDAQTGAWFRVEPRAAITAGERVLSLPEFRPKVALASGLHLDLSGGTQVLVDQEQDQKVDRESAAAAVATPTVELVYGRMMLANPTESEKHVRLRLGSKTGEAQLGRNAMLAIEVERKYVPGADPRKEPAPVECRLYAPDGGVVWKDDAGTKVIEKASRWTIGATGATEPVADTAPPDWIYNEPLVQASEQRYAPKLESALVSDTPVDMQLLEIFQSSKQREAKSLVAKSSIHVGMFEPFIKALGDPDQKSNWKTHIDALRAAMALNPESANKVWQTLVDQRGRPAAGDLFEMLCGYSADAIGTTPEQLKTGAIALLINRLEDNSLDYRVLAVQDLADITGKRLMANPAASPAERTVAIRKWRARLDVGDLKPLVAP